MISCIKCIHFREKAPSESFHSCEPWGASMNHLVCADFVRMPVTLDEILFEEDVFDD